MQRGKTFGGLSCFVKKQIVLLKIKQYCTRYMYLPIIVLGTAVAVILSQWLSGCTEDIHLSGESEYVMEVESVLEEYDDSLTPAEEEIVNSDKKINLNTASAALLDTLPGVGPIKAVSIVKVREQMNGFRSVDDLLNVEGIGDKTLLKIKDRIYIN